jgi:MoaA/NifB/PqqE/SkfB family radical SAM enzyme
LKAPLFVSWQLTRDCDLACVHCCTESAPGKRLRDELDAGSAARIAQDLIDAEVPYVMLCGGEPLGVPHFTDLATVLGRAGTHLKIETNGQRLDAGLARRLARLPIRSVQISLDGDSDAVYARQRLGGSLAKAHAACVAVSEAGMPLEITFAPTRINIHEAEAVIDRAAAFGAFRFNTGRLMRMGTAARLWQRLCPDAGQYRGLLEVLQRRQRHRGDRERGDREMELCYEPFTVSQGLRTSLSDPPATLLVLPNGQVKVAAALPFICADLRIDTLQAAWNSYRRAWHSAAVRETIAYAITDESLHAGANAWRPIDDPKTFNPERTWNH